MRIRGIGWFDASVSLEARKRLMETIILLSLTYGAEVVALTQTHGHTADWEKMNRFWAKCARITLGMPKSTARRAAINDLGWWPFFLYRDEAILRWYGKLNRMSDDRLPKIAWKSQAFASEEQASPKLKGRIRMYASLEHE